MEKQLLITQEILDANPNLPKKFKLGKSYPICSKEQAKNSVAAEGIKCCDGKCPVDPPNGHYECSLCHCILIPNPSA